MSSDSFSHVSVWGMAEFNIVWLKLSKAQRGETEDSIHKPWIGHSNVDNPFRAVFVAASWPDATGSYKSEECRRANFRKI